LNQTYGFSGALVNSLPIYLSGEFGLGWARLGSARADPFASWSPVNARREARKKTQSEGQREVEKKPFSIPSEAGDKINV